MNQKLLTFLTSVLLSVQVLAGCGASDQADRSSTGDKVTISFFHWRGEDAEVFKEMITQFEQENPNIHVDMNIFPSERYQSTAQTKLMDGSMGDVFTSFPGAQFESLAKVGLFSDLTNEPFTARFDEKLIQVGQKDGKQLALPYQLVFNQPIYNVGIFEKYGLTPPTDWDGFLALCDTLQKQGITPIAFPGADIGPGQLMNTMVMNNAPDEATIRQLETGETKLTDEWWLKTLTQFKQLTDKGYLQKDALGVKHEGAITLFAQEKAAMLATGSYAMANVKKMNPSVKMQLLAPITVASNQATWEGIHTTTFMLSINSKSKHPAEAKTFLDFLTRQETASLYANKTGQHLTVKDVNYETPELKDTVVWMERKTRFQPRFLLTNSDIQKAMVSSIQDVLSGTSPEEAAKKAQTIVDQKRKG